MSLSSKHFINLADLPLNEVHQLIDFALQVKSGQQHPRLDGKILTTVFFNPSVRTRASFISAMAELGGTTIDISPGQGAWSFEFEEDVVMDGAKVEHIKEAARVLSRYSHALAVRSSELITNAATSVDVEPWTHIKKDEVVSSFVKYATVPVISMESNVYHPCQGLGDAVTLTETLKNPTKKKYVLTWAYHPKALPMATPNSQLLAACDLGMDVVLAHPEGWDLDSDVLNLADERSGEAGGSFRVTHDLDDAYDGAEVICAKSWGAMQHYSDWETETQKRNQLKHWIVDADKMSKTDDAYFMHCLPVRRNVVVTDEVLDSPRSIIIDQAENRKWAQLSLLYHLLA